MNKIISICFVLVILLPLPRIFAWEYPSNESGYPYKDSEEDLVDQWNTYTRNCTSYVMWKINQTGKSFNNNPTGPNGNTTTMGNAGSWDEHAADIGYTVDNTPNIGDAMNWEAYSGGAGSAGHVAWVEKVNPNGTVFLSEWNWNYGNGKYNERDGYRGDNYLHIVNSSSSSCTLIQNREIGSGQNLNCSGNNIQVLPETVFSYGSNINLKSI